MTAPDGNAIQVDWELDWERFLPTQRPNNKCYEGAESYEQKFHDILESILNVKAPQSKFVLQESSLFTINQMASSPLALELIQFIIRSIGAKKVLEIGTFIGLSTMYFAEAVQPDGFVVTIEKFQDFAEIARANFVANKLEQKIELILGDAYSVLASEKINSAFDVIFIDGNKERYADYLELATDKDRNLLSERGIIIIDNVTCHGDVLNPQQQTAKGVGVLACLEKIKSLSESEWQTALIPFHDGQIILRRA
ncbi:MAG: hypothetical protein F6J93_11580 [Oscillatoria sp. SIO1A7]|nr:hypothetical protein [Oscillatoria sp. SIO1A7]